MAGCLLLLHEHLDLDHKLRYSQSLQVQEYSLLVSALRGLRQPLNPV
jgi:hypothetical protein